MTASIAKVRQAVEQLRASEKAVTLPNIKKLLAATQSELVSLLRINGLKEELGIVSAFDAIGLRYKDAANRLSKRGEPVTIASLACELNCKRSSVAMRISRNEECKTELGLVSGHEARRLKRAAAYKVAVEQLRANRQQVTQTKIADLTGHDRALVCRDLAQNAFLAASLLPKTKNTESA